MKNEQGFTLVEVLISMAIFALISTLSYSALTQALQTEAVQKERAEALQELQIALAYIERDLGQVEAESLQFLPNELRFNSLQNEGLLSLRYLKKDQSWIREEAQTNQQNPLSITLIQGLKSFTVVPIRNDAQLRAIEIQLNHEVFGQLIKKVYIDG